ncbi:MAG: methionine adenosyltransferase [Pseudobdellovibrionaceae bacterium]
MSKFYFTSESVSEGHPDKVCDRISDTIVDHYLANDPEARCAIETAVTTDFVCILGEARGPDTITAQVLEDLARKAIKDIGYDQRGFSWKSAKMDIRVHSQSADIAMGVDASGDKDEGAGDQGIMFGYACTETEDLMPAPIYYAHKILKTLADARKDGSLKMLEPDAKSQVTLKYVDGKPVGAKAIVLSTQHKEGLSQNDVREIVRPYIEGVLPEGWMCEDELLYVNPTGRFVIGGPVGDAGLTGRKIIVDTYGGAALHGGGAFSGKDPTKVDRSAAYASRYVAKNIVAAGFAEKCTIQVSYAIGISRPISLYVNTHGTGNVDEERLAEAIQNVMDLSPRGIRQHLKLNRPIYARTSAYGHFGRKPDDDGGFSWEKTDLVDALKTALS